MAEINAALRAAEPMRALAARVGATYTAIQQHRLHMLQPGGNPPTTGEQSAGIDDNPRKITTLRERAERMFRRVARLLKRAENGDDTIDLRACAGIARELRGVLELQAKLDGELKAASTTVNVFQSPDWQAVKSLLVEALTPFPEAALAVAEVIEAQEQGAAQPPRKPSPLN